MTEIISNLMEANLLRVFNERDAPNAGPRPLRPPTLRAFVGPTMRGSVSVVKR